MDDEMITGHRLSDEDIFLASDFVGIPMAAMERFLGLLRATASDVAIFEVTASPAERGTPTREA